MVTKGKVRKGAKKSFYKVSAPLTSATISLYSYSEDELEGQIVKLDLTRSLKGKNFEFKLEIKKGKEGLIGSPRSLNLIGSYIRRVMRRGTDYVEDSFEAECKDGKVRIKPFLITRKRVSRAVRRALREVAKKNLISYIKGRETEELFSDIMTNKMQKDLSAKLRKIYPLALCEIRRFEVVSKEK